MGGLTSGVLLLALLAWAFVAGGMPAPSSWTDSDRYVVGAFGQLGAAGLLWGVFWMLLARVARLRRTGRYARVFIGVLAALGVIAGVLFSLMVGLSVGRDI